MAGIPAARLAIYERRFPPQSSNAKMKPYPHLPTGQQFQMVIITTEPNPWFRSRYEAIGLLNFPGMFGAVLIDRLTPAWPYDWTPAWTEPLGMWGWRALSWPVFDLPFWWLAGRGLDAFISSLNANNVNCRIRWFEGWGFAILGTIIAIFCAGLSLMPDPRGDFPEMRWQFLPGIMWFVFGLISLLAWWRQRRARGARLTEMHSITE